MAVGSQMTTLLLITLLIFSICGVATTQTLSQFQPRRLLSTPAPPLAASPTSGPCSASNITLAVRSFSDIAARRQYRNNVTVILEFYNNFTLTSPLILDSTYACTILRPSATVTSPIWITAATDGFYPFMINSTSNILVRSINFYIPFNGSAGYNPPVNCNVQTSMSHSSSCPAVLVDRSWGVEMRKCSIYGRLDVIRTVNSLFDSLTVVSPNMNQFNGWGAVQLLTGGDPVNLISSNLTLSNSDISGGMNGIMLTYQMVGARVVNNFVHNYTQQGINCGQGVHNVADCLLSTIAYNYVLTEPFVKSTDDSAGLYFDTHWTGIGNELRCNYVVGAGHCLYLDYASSNVKVMGGACIGSRSAIKMNTGKNNFISGLIIQPTNSSTVGSLSNQNYYVNNCLLDPGVNWTAALTKTYFTSPSSPWAKAAPQLINFCNRTTVTWNNTVMQCNPVGRDSSGTYPTANQTGKCSGLPTSNFVNVYVLDNPTSVFRLFNNLYPSSTGGMLSTGYVFAMNTINVLYYTNVSAQVNDVKGGDFGVASTSPLYTNGSNFVSCPRREVGIQSPSTSAPTRAVFNSFIAGAHVHGIISRALPDTYPKDGYHIESQHPKSGHHSTGGHHRSGGHHTNMGHHHHHHRHRLANALTSAHQEQLGY